MTYCNSPMVTEVELGKKDSRRSEGGTDSKGNTRTGVLVLGFNPNEILRRRGKSCTKDTRQKNPPDKTSQLVECLIR